MNRSLRIIAFILIVSSFAIAQRNLLSPSSKYNPAIPTVESVLGYKVGEDFTPYFLLDNYYQKLAAASDRVTMEHYGKTAEGRNLSLVIITSAKNHARMATIKETIAKLNDSRKTTPEEAATIAGSTPVIVYLSYNVHGNEASSSEACLQVAYELAASEDDNVKGWLENAVIVIDPLVNPDGRERFVQGYRSVKGAQPIADRFAAEQQERWPGGRYNHYMFDMNRDWTWQTQNETKQRVAVYRTWNPQVHVDYHEMGASASYYFAPATEPILEALNTPMLKKWFDIYGKANAQAFDKNGFRFFTKDGYDMYYPGFGDSWPTLNGAVGMTYEQAGGRAGVELQLADNQRLLTLTDRATRHFLTSMATINTSVVNRVERLKDYYEYRRSAVKSGEQAADRYFFIVPGPDKDRADKFVNIMLRQGVEVQRATAEFEVSNTSNYWGEKSATKKFGADTYVVDSAQPLGFLVRALLDREPKLNATFFYDVTAWAMPLAAGLDGYIGGRPPANLQLKPVTAVPVNSSPGKTSTDATAYVFSSVPTASIRLLGYLLQEDIKVYVATQGFKQDGRDFPVGSMVVSLESNPPSVGARVVELAAKAGATVYPLRSGFSDTGVDLGSSRVRFLRKPKVAVLMDSPVFATEYGFIWHMFEQEYQLPFTPIKVENFSGVDLNSYNVIILPPDSGDGSGYSRTIGGMSARLKDWVRGGGILIGIRGGAVFATKRKSGLTSVNFRWLGREDEEARKEDERQAAKKDETGSSEPPPPAPTKEEIEKDRQTRLERKLRKYADKEKEAQVEDVPGAILRAQLDNTHPIGYGMSDRVAVLDQAAPILELSDKGDNVVYFPKENLKLTGFITPENEKKLFLTAFAVRERSGRGSVILFADSPVFRGFWDGSSRMLLNAVYFGNVTIPGVN